MIQSRLRPAGGTGYTIPRGFLFDALRVTCANYTAEIWGWICFTVAVQTVAPGLFILTGGAQMAIWGTQKHARLRRVRLSLEAKLMYAATSMARRSKHAAQGAAKP